MILDKGVCSVFRVRDGRVSGGGMPQKTYDLVCQSPYGELSFESVPRQEVKGDLGTETSERIRIWQTRGIDGLCVVCLEQTATVTGKKLYKVKRAYHGFDSESGMDITDLTLSDM